MLRPGSLAAVIVPVVAGCASSPSPPPVAPLPVVNAQPVAATPAPAPAPTSAPAFTDLIGTWQGVMNEGQPSAIRAELQLARLPSGDYVGRVLVPEQGADLRASSITLKDNAFRFELKQVGGVFEGTVNVAKTLAQGKWTQTGVQTPQPVVFRRSVSAMADAAGDAKPAVPRGIDRLPKTAAPFTMPFTVRLHGRPNVLRGHGASYVVYELELANTGRRAATILSLDVITLATAAGNQVSLDLGGGFTAFYAHLQPGSVRVKVGDRVKRGQVLGLLGNSGNSTGPHLHFQISRGATILGSEGVPFAYREYRLITPPPGKPPTNAPSEVVRGEIPLAGDIVMFADQAASASK